jgi:glyoxylase-like metal-dependent hydrolase (beta-lactamase superfamily II)
MLASHAHFDHVGGHFSMQQLTGATVMALGDDAAAISSGVDNSALGASGWKPATVGRVLPAIFVAQHPNIFAMEDKVKRIKAGGPNPFIDRLGYEGMVAAAEPAYLTQLKREQGK